MLTIGDLAYKHYANLPTDKSDVIEIVYNQKSHLNVLLKAYGLKKPTGKKLGLHSYLFKGKEQISVSFLIVRYPGFPVAGRPISADLVRARCCQQK